MILRILVMIPCQQMLTMARSGCWAILRTRGRGMWFKIQPRAKAGCMCNESSWDSVRKALLCGVYWCFADDFEQRDSGLRLWMWDFVSCGEQKCDEIGRIGGEKVNSKRWNDQQEQRMFHYTSNICSFYDRQETNQLSWLFRWSCKLCR